MYRFVIKGIVQGVGFRPFIYRKACERGVLGHVKNTGEGVEIVSDEPDFVDNITDWPSLVRIDSVKRSEVEGDYDDFRILESSGEGGFVPADISLCSRCLKELRDPENRRHGYHFLTCTDCGPRFSMVESTPYDRPYTSMADFEMCSKCRKEYENPADRRYHAQTIACPDCGPKLELQYNSIALAEGVSAIEQAAALLRKGEIVGIKGVGGFHLCCLPDDDTVMKLRYMLDRHDKPFALMVRDETMLSGIACYSKKELELMSSRARPIVLLEKKKDFPLVSELDTFGVMLPYTALHHLLFDHLDSPVVMTSANMPGEPVSVTEEYGEYFLTHDRRIVNRCDDSVVKVLDKPCFLRRSRGYVPYPVNLPFSSRAVIALGGETNTTLCCAEGKRAYLSQHIGDVSNLKTYEFMRKTVDSFLKLTKIKPEVVLSDLHPEYMSTRLATELSGRLGCEHVQVQHHEAHVAGVAAEHGISEYTGIACDGMGYGRDGKIWGGEVFSVGDSFERIGHLEYQALLGGDSATRHPKKVLFAILAKILTKDRLFAEGLFSQDENDLYYRQFTEGFNCAETSSTGRVIDAASAFLGLCDYASYEGRPALLLESVATEPYDISPQIEDGTLLTTPLFSYLLKNRDKDKGRLAATVFYYLASGFYELARGGPVVFSGGVAYNGLMTRYLARQGVLTHNEVPAGDGGLSFGQVARDNFLYY
ncbi:MAG: carbamoyltransferase HypF [Candidatus Woesearchaeota archaeon]